MAGISRRNFLKMLGFASIAIPSVGGTLGATVFEYIGQSYYGKLTYQALDPKNSSNFVNPLNVPSTNGGYMGILYRPGQFDIYAQDNMDEYIPGIKTKSWDFVVNYNGNTYVDPIIVVRKGDQITTTLHNNLPPSTNRYAVSPAATRMEIIHWHGLYVPWTQDGHPLYQIAPGQTYNYNFTVYNRGSTYWYHTHVMSYSAMHDWYGLRSMFIVEDENDDKLRKALDLTLGETEIPLLIQDTIFDEYGNLVFAPDMMDYFMGYFGNQITVNGVVNPYLEVDTRVYRFRIVNSSNARIYRLSFVKNGLGPNIPFYIIGSDGGLLDKPYQVYEAFIGVAERLDILLDLRNFNPGDVIFLQTQHFDPYDAEPGMPLYMTQQQEFGANAAGSQWYYYGYNGTMMGALNYLPENAQFNILKLVVKNKVSYDLPIPEELAPPIEPIDISGADTRQLVLAPNVQMMQWMINGMTFNLYQIPITVQKGETVIWEITNVDQSMPHPFHFHAGLFQVLERRNSVPQIAALAVDNKGRLPSDLGWKDTVLIWPGETIRIAMSFTGLLSGTTTAPDMNSTAFAGRQIYLMHCHNFEHEDIGFMLNYAVE